MTTGADRAPSVADRPDDENPPSWAALVIVLAGILMTFLDFFIINVTVPSIQRDFGNSAALIQFVIVGYGVALAAAMVTGGRLGDMFGRRRIFTIGMVLFTLTSLVCGIAQTGEVLVVSRVLQGIAAALLTPQVLAIINTVYTGARLATAYTAYGLVIGLSGVFGQLIGGLLIDLDIAGLTWRTVFLINIPIGLAALAVTRRSVPESKADGKPRLDLVGMVLLTLGLVALVLPLIQGREEGWPAWSLVCLLAAVPLLGAFVVYENRLAQRGGAPLLDPSLFHERVFSFGLVTVLVYFMAMGSFFLILALYLQQGFGLSALQSGLMFGLMSAGFFGSSFLARRVGAKLGHQVIALGAGSVAVGYAVVGVAALNLDVADSVLWIIPGLLVAGFGMGFVAAPLPSAVLAGVEPNHVAAASGALSTMQEGGAALGVALVGTLFYPVLAQGSGAAAYLHAFAVSTFLLVGFAFLVVVLAQFLRSRAATAS
jgi:EmrB/QacA subfamily drug resistance transporter